MDSNTFNQSEGGSKTPMIIGVVVVIILIGLGLYFWLGGKNETNIIPTDENPVVTTPTDNGYVQIVNVKHQYKAGTHTYAGEIDLPTPCDTLKSEAVKDATTANKFTLTFTTTKSSQVCAQVITSKPFKISFKADKDVTVDATLDGKKLRLNTYEVREDQDLDSYDIYIKG